MMGRFFTPLAIAYAGVMLMAASGSPSLHAVSLEVTESSDSATIELVGHSSVQQRVAYEMEVIGSSRARHSGATTIPAGERLVLSRMNIGFAKNWCARVDVEEETGATYTLTAGNCPR